MVVVSGAAVSVVVVCAVVTAAQPRTACLGISPVFARMLKAGLTYEWERWWTEHIQTGEKGMEALNLNPTMAS